MNTACIGVPVLMSSFFIIIGAILSAKHRRVGEAYDVLLNSLNQFSDLWKPNDPKRFDNNERLFDIFKSILAEGSQILSLLQIMAIGWAIIAVFIIMFYIGTAISVGKVTQRTMRMANGQGALPKFRFESWRTLSMSHSTASGRHDNLADSKAEADHVSYQAGTIEKLFFLKNRKKFIFPAYKLFEHFCLTLNGKLHSPHSSREAAYCYHSPCLCKV
ncbi:hypothetical protein PCASD_08799 [Puccinia coronata f. sp. avenae]|uniref:Uncharacterized protein n=1 Tax=Puccinia coronata f. sp. avenae TaxID=200324 RepID=A0A2N5UPC8_9BASI|nr:hypothetical protein PCASD_08799 [Puccinia coronata f. sp. avenae]